MPQRNPAIEQPESVVTWPQGRAFHLEGVVVARNGTRLLDGVDLVFEPGRRYILVGPSGAGKSTLLRLLNRLEDPAEGRVTIGDHDLRTISPRLVRTAVGLVFQGARPLSGTVADNLAYPFGVRGMRASSKPDLAAALSATGLDPGWLGRDASALSGGERQRLALAVALMIPPEILLLDEPTSALDPESVRTVVELLDRLAKGSGLRTIAVSHHRGHAPFLGDTAVIMERGRVKEKGPAADVLDHRGVFS
jgi:putative ABC transport system ATP-binding protein